MKTYWYSFVFVAIDIVAANITAFLGLNMLDGEYYMVETVTNRLWKRVITSREGE